MLAAFRRSFAYHPDAGVRVQCIGGVGSASGARCFRAPPSHRRRQQQCGATCPSVCGLFSKINQISDRASADWLIAIMVFVTTKIPSGHHR